MWVISSMGSNNKDGKTERKFKKKPPAKGKDFQGMRWIPLVAGLFFLVIVARLFQIQVLLANELQDESHEMREEERVIKAPRGSIYDANGIELAVDASVYSLWIDASYLRSNLTRNNVGKEEAAAAIAGILSLEPGYVLRKIELNSGFVWLKKEVSFEEVEGIKALEYTGLYFQEEPSRYYPGHAAGGNLLGFVNKTGTGVAGIESTYNAVLQGEDGYMTGELDGRKNFIANTEKILKEEVPGNSITLTIDQKAQYIAEREIANIRRELNPDNAVIMVMETKTGAILASANTNTYDPNNYKDLDTALFTTLEFQSVFEPGSIMKIVTSAAAINENVSNESSTYYGNGFRKIGTHTIKCHIYPSAHGEETMTEAMANSCNPVYVDIAMLLKKKDPDIWFEYLDRFGFGSRSAISFGGESPGIMPAGTGDIYHATSAIGQGIAVTPVQMLVAASAVANDGQKMKPLLVKNILNANGEVIQEFEPTIEAQVVSKDTAEAVQRMMVSVVEQGIGTAFRLSNGISSMGKTGTAQKAAPGGVYASGKYVLTYVGMAPAEDPKYTVLVFIDEARKNGHVSSTTAPYYKAVMEDILALYGETAGAAAVPNTQVMVPDLAGLPLEDGRILLDSLGLVLVPAGSGYIVRQNPKAFTVLQKGGEVRIEAEEAVLTETQTIVPTFLGLRLPAAIARGEGAALKMTYKGTGVVRSQNPAPGTMVEKDTEVIIELGE